MLGRRGEPRRPSFFWGQEMGYDAWAETVPRTDRGAQEENQSTRDMVGLGPLAFWSTLPEPRETFQRE